MSRLIELIRKLGQQSQQPLGFGALASKVEATPSVALIGAASASSVSDNLNAINGDIVDAVILNSDDVDPAKGLDCGDDLIWGVGPGSLNDEDVQTLVRSGCDFFVIDPSNAPAAIVSETDIATIVTLAEPADRETSLALRELGVNGSLSRPPEGLKEIAFRDLVAIRRIGSSVGGAVLVEAPAEVSAVSLAALRDAGVDAVVVPLSEPERVSDMAEKIRGLPPRKKSSGPGETRFQALAPAGGSD